MDYAAVVVQWMLLLLILSCVEIVTILWSNLLSTEKISFSVSFLPCVYLFPRFVILRVHSHGLVTIDLQCYEEDNISQLDNVGDKKNCHSAACHMMLLSLSCVS